MSIGVMLTVKGLKKLKKSIGDEELKWQQALAGAVYESGNRVIGDAVKKAPVAPKFGGFLKQSAYQTYPQRTFVMTHGARSSTFGPSGRSNDFETKIGFNAVYAAKVEDTARKPDRRQYFTNAFNKYASGHLSFVQDRARQNYKAGRGLKKNRKYNSGYVRGGTKNPRRGGSS